ncbi:hypothetical protein SLS58_006802 [Diplodia intermedia]|uniref:Uncharacterized protein n=1 Tax=Diplodia intermedia TaxID=856260 RepID=A0ABR3TMK4_9PEZI
MPPAPPRRPEKHGPSHALARHSPELNGSSERRREQSNQRIFAESRAEEHPRRSGFSQQPLPSLPPPPVHQLTGYERERRRESERRLSVGPRELSSLRENVPIQPIGQALPSTRAYIHEENRAIELTRLNTVVVQRNNTIAEAHRQIEDLKEEVFHLKLAATGRLNDQSPSDLRNALKQKCEEFEKIREALGSRTEMTVALHNICDRQHGFLRAIGGSIYANDAVQKRQFEGWIGSNELYMAHVKRQVAFETNWEDMVRRANDEAMKEIERAAQQVAQQAAQQVLPYREATTGLQTLRESGNQHTEYDVKHAVEQLIQEATEELGTKP